MLTPEQLTLFGVAISIGTLGLMRKWVFGWVYDAMVEERNFWRDLALKFADNSDKAIEHAERRS